MKRKTLGYVITGVCIFTLLIALYLTNGMIGLLVVLATTVFATILVLGMYLIFDDTKKRKPITADDIIDKSVTKEFKKLNKVLEENIKLRDELGTSINFADLCLNMWSKSVNRLIDYNNTIYIEYIRLNTRFE